MGIKSYIQGKRQLRQKVNMAYKQGYGIHNLNMSHQVQRDVDERRENLRNKYEYHAQKGSNFGSDMREFNRGSSAGLLDGINSLRHQVMAAHYKRKLKGKNMDKWALKHHMKSGGTLEAKKEENQSPHQQEEYSVNIKEAYKKVKKPIKNASRGMKRFVIGDSGNKQIPYRSKKAVLEFQSFDSAKKKVNAQMEHALRNPDKVKGKRLEKLKRRHFAANTKMSIKDERKFYKTRDNKASKRFLLGLQGVNIAGYGVDAAAAAIGGPTALAISHPITMGAYYAPMLSVAAVKNRKHILDRRYEYMKKHGYVK